MKTKLIIFILLVLLLLPTLLTSCLATFAEEEVVCPSVPDESLYAISAGLDTLALARTVGNRMENHGGNQNRVVYTSSGTYLGIMLSTIHPHISSNQVQAAMIRVNEDGTAETICTDFISDGSTTVSIMADKKDDVWMYSGWENNGFFHFKLWHYDVASDRVTAYDSTQSLVLGDSYGYSVAMIDAAHNKIYAFSPGGETPGYMLWCEFDIELKEWKQHRAIMLDSRYLYLHAYPDGKGGILLQGKHGKLLKDVIFEDGVSAFDAIKTYRTRSFDWGYLGDALHLLYIPDPNVAELQNIVVEDATYDYKNGIYPNQRDGWGDMFITSDGHLHFLYTVDADGVPGIYTHHKIYDISDGFKEIYHERMKFLYGDKTLYCARMYEDLSGNVYIFAMDESEKAVMEVWKATDELSSKFKLVHNEALRCNTNSFDGRIILANNRNNSTPSDIASFIYAANGTWYLFRLDLTHFANR